VEPYANKHRGICLAFEVNDKFVGRVRYSDRRIPIEWKDEASGMVSPSWMRSPLLTKSDHWSYEKEFRSYLQLDATTREHGLYFYRFNDKVALEEVICGPLCEMPAARLATLIRAIDNSVTITENELASKSFRIIPILRIGGRHR
jgi:hypothetical protein